MLQKNKEGFCPVGIALGQHTIETAVAASSATVSSFVDVADKGH